MATILNTGLDRDTVALCISLCERGANPEALAVKILWVIKTTFSKSPLSFIDCDKGSTRTTSNQETKQLIIPPYLYPLKKINDIFVLLYFSLH
jgi:hypothetical protein